jgi:N-acetylneuraminate synthase
LSYVTFYETDHLEMVMAELSIKGRKIGEPYPPLVIAEIGINHEGSLDKALQMVDDAVAAGCECVKFQCHVIDDEMIPNNVIPGNAKESIWDIMERCALNEREEHELKAYCDAKGVLFLSTPFSRAAADRLEKMDVPAYKIGSGECNNYPLIEHIAAFGKPVILSTGMNDLLTIERSVEILRRYEISFALLHCTSMYPTPYEKIRLGAIGKLKEKFPDAVVGLSDHSLSNYPCLGAVACGASILERHFVSDKSWPGPDVEISMDPIELSQLIEGSRILHACRGGEKEILPEEQPTIDFAYASVVSIAPIRAGERFSKENIWVKRPGTGEILAGEFDRMLGRKATVDIPDKCQLKREWVLQ